MTKAYTHTAKATMQRRFRNCDHWQNRETHPATRLRLVVFQTALGSSCKCRRGAIQDDVYAHMRFIIAASPGSTLAPINRDDGANEMTSELIAQAQKLARECVAKNYKNCRLSRLSEMHHGNESVLGSISRNSALIFRIRLLLILLPYWPAPIQHSPKKSPAIKAGPR